MNTATLLSAEGATPVSETKVNSPRFHELDSMRGLAAFVVLLTHVVVVFRPALVMSVAPAALAIYPLLSAHESVIFFFLLSGFVLALPFLRAKNQAYSVYIHRRILRIYGPYLCALVIAVTGTALWHNHHPGIADWIPGIWDRPVAFGLLIQHILFIGNYDKAYEPAFWSLVHEMRISILFPFMFILVRKIRIQSAALLILLCTLIGTLSYTDRLVVLLGATSLATVQYIGVFVVGILLATHRERLGHFYRRIAIWQRFLLLVGSLCLYNGWHLLADRGPMWHLGDLPIAIGAAGLMIVGLNSVLARRILNASIPTFLGKISYSLYLVHEVVLYALLATVSTRISHLMLACIYLPASILLAWGFYFAVEQPFTALSRNAGRAISLPTPLPSLVPADATESAPESTLLA